MIRLFFRAIQSALFLISLGVLLASLYFQFVRHMQPCPLCIMQRFALLMTLSLSLSAIFITYINRQNLILTLQWVTAFAGAYFAGRQMWLQSLPADQMPACLPGLDILIRYFPLKDSLHALFWGTAECGEVIWQWLGLSMAAWSFLYFLSYGLIVLLIRFMHRH